MHPSQSTAKVVFLLGPTASGKTAASLALAEQLNAEIVSVDSALVYRGMDIGTAKPNAQELAQVPHHLIDVCDPTEAYSVARFCADVLPLIKRINDDGKVALLTGGTMMYFNALEKGIASLPNADAEVRERLSKRAQAEGWPALHKTLEAVDPVAATRIHPNDPQRLQRALEVYELTGQPLSTLQKNTQPLLAEAPIKIALLPESRAWLHERIERRFGIMLAQGFAEEVEGLMRLPGINADLPSMRSVGYRQMWQHLSGRIDAATLENTAVIATRQLAKRQITWIRSMQNLHCITCDTLDMAAQLQSILQWVSSESSLNKPS